MHLRSLRDAGLALGLASFNASLSWASGCALPADAGQRLDGEGVQLAWRPVPAPIKVGATFALELQMCPTDVRILRVDATMPDHRHGMNYRPSIQTLGGGRWRVEGLVWHMSGRWELRVDVEAAGRQQALRQSVTLP